MSNKNKIEIFLQKLKGDFSIIEIEEIFDQIDSSILPNYDDESFDNLSSDEKALFERLMVRSFYKRVNVYENFIDKWEKGLFVPNEKELEKLKNYQNKFDTIILPQYSEIKKHTPSIPGQIEEEEKISKGRKKTLDELLKNDEYRQKAKELLKKHGNSPAFPLDNNDVKKMTDLLNRVNELEEKLKQTPNSESDKQELIRLKTEIGSLKNKQKNKSQNENKEQDKKSNFPTGLVIGGGIVIVALLLVIIFLTRKITK